MSERETFRSLVASWRHRRPFARRRGFGIDEIGIFNFFSPTHSPPPLSRPAGRKRGASCGRVFKGGKSELDCALPSKWLPCRPEAHKSISAQQHRAFKGLNDLQQIENPRNQFDGSVPLRTFFPALKTRPNVAVRSLSAPAGVERVGVRGGIQRKRNKNTANSQVDKSSPVSHRAQEIHLKTEHIAHTRRGLEAKNIQRNAVSPPAGSRAPNRRINP